MIVIVAKLIARRLRGGNSDPAGGLGAVVLRSAAASGRSGRDVAAAERDDRGNRSQAPRHGARPAVAAAIFDLARRRAAWRFWPLHSVSPRSGLAGGGDAAGDDRACGGGDGARRDFSASAAASCCSICAARWLEPVADLLHDPAAVDPGISLGFDPAFRFRRRAAGAAVYRAKSHRTCRYRMSPDFCCSMRCLSAASMSF